MLAPCMLLTPFKTQEDAVNLEPICRFNCNTAWLAQHWQLEINSTQADTLIWLDIPLDFVLDGGPHLVVFRHLRRLRLGCTSLPKHDIRICDVVHDERSTGSRERSVGRATVVSARLSRRPRLCCALMGTARTATLKERQQSTVLQGVCNCSTHAPILLEGACNRAQRIEAFVDD